MNLFKNIYKFKNKQALVCENNEILKYGDLLSFTDNISKKIKERCLVFLICNNNLESIVGYLSFLKTNCVINLIDYRIDNKHLDKLIKIYRPTYIFLSKNKSNFIADYSVIETFIDYVLIESKFNFKINLNDKLCLLVSTSGSTGTPKNVRISYENIENNVESIINSLKISHDDISITTLPMSYVYGLSIINTHFAMGAKIVLNNKSIIHKKFWQLFYLHKVNNFGGVPYTYQILDKLNIKEHLKTIKYSTQAGGKLGINISKKIINLYKKYNRVFIMMYGAAEATARMSYLPWEHAEEKVGSIGIPIPGGKFIIEDDNKNIIEKNDEKGELIYFGPNVSLGYANNFNDLHKGDENKNRLNTGDIAKKDKDNFYYIVGRKNRYAKVYGNRINLSELEYIIMDYGIQSKCENNYEDKITVYVTKVDDKKKLINYLSKITYLHPSVFIIKITKKFEISSNLKLSINS